MTQYKIWSSHVHVRSSLLFCMLIMLIRSLICWFEILSFIFLSYSCLFIMFPAYLYLWHFLNCTLSISLFFFSTFSCPISSPTPVPAYCLHCFLLIFVLLLFPHCLLHLLFHSVHFLPVGPQALLVRALLEYSQSSESCVPYGLSLVAGIFLMELMRSWSLALMWAVNYRTAARLRGAALTFAFNKILRLRSTKDVGPGEVGDLTLEGTHLQIS